MSDSITYQQLQPEDRITIATMHQQGCSVRAMARVLHRAPSTVSRELVRNTASGERYRSHVAQLTCQARQLTARPVAKLQRDGLRWGLVLTMLNWNWSPQQIAGALRRAFPDQPDWNPPGIMRPNTPSAVPGVVGGAVSSFFQEPTGNKIKDAAQKVLGK